MTASATTATVKSDRKKARQQYFLVREMKGLSSGLIRFMGKVFQYRSSCCRSRLRTSLKMRAFPMAFLRGVGAGTRDFFRVMNFLYRPKLDKARIPQLLWKRQLVPSG